MKNIFCLAILGSLLTGISAQAVETSVSGGTVTRFRHDDDESKMQATVWGKLEVDFEVDAEGEVKVVAIARNGETLNNGFTNLHNFDTDESLDGMKFYLRQLYVQYVRPNLEASLGALETRKTDGGVTQLYPFAYIDGGRLAVDTGLVKVTVTLGSVGEFDKPGVNDRDFDSTNYLEVALERALWEDAKVEVGHEEIEDEDYLRMVFSQDVDILGRKVGLVAEGIYDQTNKALHSGLTAKVPLNENYDFSYSLIRQEEEYAESIRHQNMVDGTLIGENGTSHLLKLSGKINKNVSWYGQTRVHSEDTRFDLGVKAKF